MIPNHGELRVNGQMSFLIHYLCRKSQNIDTWKEKTGTIRAFEMISHRCYEIRFDENVTRTQRLMSVASCSMYTSSCSFKWIIFICAYKQFLLIISCIASTVSALNLHFGQTHRASDCDSVSHFCLHDWQSYIFKISLWTYYFLPFTHFLRLIWKKMSWDVVKE